MHTESWVRSYRQVAEERARHHAANRDWDAWLSACKVVQTLDIVLEDEGKPGYVEPIERIPFTAEFAQRYAASKDAERADMGRL